MSSDGDEAPNDENPETASLFDHPKADVILRSSDGVDFRTFKIVLSLASPVFSDMFDMPQPPREGSGEEDGSFKDGLPVVTLSESSVLLKKVLRLCYPLGESLDDDDMEDIRLVANAAIKYDMGGIIKLLRKSLRQPKILMIQQFAVYGIACHFEFQEELKLAAKYTLRYPSGIFSQYLKYMTGEDYHRLITYHNKCGDVASKLTREFRWIRQTSSSSVWFTCTACRGADEIFVVGNARGHTRPRAWWTDFMAQAGAALKDRPLGIVITSAMTKPYLQRAIGCILCRQSAVHEMEIFVQEFAEEVEKVTGEVMSQSFK